MEKRRESLSTLKLCRFCLSQSDNNLISMYDKYRAPKSSVTLPLKILSCFAVEVFPSDKMPTYICQRCKFFIDISYEFKHMCRQADKHILQFVQNGLPLSALTWPQSLLKLYRKANKPPEVAVMKTIIEGGATIQVTAQESDSDEEDDENVYNVKIGDGSDDGSKSARVKVITSADQHDKGKPKRGKDPEENDCNGMDSQVRTSEIRDGCWPCDECECTYPLQQLLELHKSQKHRDRNVQCTRCDAKFFTTYDMLAHQVTHTDEKSFQCVACDKKFKRLILLKRHEKLMHPDLPQRPCPHCPATFLSVEELEAHQTKHARHTEKRFECNICDKRFQEKATLQRHIENMHNRKPKYSCEYCPSRFTSTAKLSRHVRTHAGDRSYPCKFCNKSFIKSHHYTRHLRLKHRENIRTCRGPFGESDQYRCEQCEDSFATQDELIYHSAIHATENLVCPLCQERFEDVDAVTTHIRSHVNGMEFMCELCELVFTNQEKLDTHMAITHDDELQSVPDIGQDESSMEMDDDDDDGINVKELDDHMVVEIKKADDYMLSNSQIDAEVKIDNTNSEESDTEVTYSAIPDVDMLAIANKEPRKGAIENAAAILLTSNVTITKNIQPKNTLIENQTASILRKAEEVKKKVVQQSTPEPIAEKKDNKIEKTNNNTGASDKSLRLLEKELQELKRTNTRSEAVKTPVKPIDTLRSRRAQIHTSTPKPKPIATEEKKTPVVVKSPAVEKKLPERRVVTKENKEPKESKESKQNNASVKEEKEKEREVKEKETEVKEKEKEVKEKETPKNVVKNGNNDKTPEEGSIRRSTRPSKIKDYAKMIQDRSQDSDDNEDSEDTDDEEYKQAERSNEIKPRARRSSVKTPTQKLVNAGVTPTPRKRGRPRKEPAVAPKVRKEQIEDDVNTSENTEIERSNKKAASVAEAKQDASETTEAATSATEQKADSGVLVSPSGQTLKKVSKERENQIPIKSLPPGVKPMPLPINARPMGGGEVCEMQIGKKVVKVQKIVMTKAEVEAMAKKGLVEMKDGTMVLKQGIKLPTADSSVHKPNLVVEDTGKESPSKKDKATPTRCDFGEDA